MDGSVVWMPEVAKVMAVLRFKDEGGYGKIRKVCISWMTNIPTIVDFAGKKSKIAVVGKSITTNPGYFSSGRFLNGEGVKRLLFSQLGSLVKD
jgi:hypothetical protein